MTKKSLVLRIKENIGTDVILKIIEEESDDEILDSRKVLEELIATYEGINDPEHNHVIDILVIRLGRVIPAKLNDYTCFKIRPDKIQTASITPEEYTSYVLTLYGLEYYDLQDKKVLLRNNYKRNIVTAALFEICYSLKLKYNLSLEKIGSLVGGRKKSTIRELIIKGCKKQSLDLPTFSNKNTRIKRQ